MRRGAHVWSVEEQRCVKWSLRPDDAEPTRGGISWTKRRDDGVIETYGYGYDYGPDRIVLTGGGGTRKHPDGSGEAWGLGCMSNYRVEHREGASEVGGVLWHYTLGSCRAEARARARARERGEDVASASLGC